VATARDEEHEQDEHVQKISSNAHFLGQIVLKFVVFQNSGCHENCCFAMPSIAKQAYPKDAIHAMFLILIYFYVSNPLKKYVLLFESLLQKAGHFVNYMTTIQSKQLP
jgi:hypothetical protein